MLRIILIAALLIVSGALLYALWPTEQELEVSPLVIVELKKLRAQDKYVDEYGIIKYEERTRLEPVINGMLDSLISGLPNNPRKSWAIAEMQKAVAQFYLEDTELREPSVGYIAQVIKILGIKRTNNAFARYLIFV